MKVYKRDESKLHFANLFVLYSNAVAIALIIICVVLGICVKDARTVSAVIAVACLFWGTFCDKYFTYQHGLTIEIKGDGSLLYKYNQNRDFVPTGRTEVSILCKKIQKIKFRKNSCVISGEISVVKPFKNYTCKKVVLFTNFGEETESLLEDMKKLELSR